MMAARSRAWCALEFIYPAFAVSGPLLATLFCWSCSSRAESRESPAACCCLWSKACRRGLNASPRARFTRLSSACSIPSIARRCQWLIVIQLTFIWRQTSTGLQRSVHTARTAWTLSLALWLREGDFFFFSVLGGVLSFIVFQVVHQFLFFIRAAEFQFEFAFLGPQHDRLAFHPADHVEGGAGLAAQRQFQEVLFNAGLHGLAQLALDLKEAIRRAESFDALMRTLVVVIFNPEF